MHPCSSPAPSADGRVGKLRFGARTMAGGAQAPARYAPRQRREPMLREIVLDTETTGLDPDQGHRIVEVAALELVDHLPTGRTFHSYVNPQRDMPEEAFRVHGLSAAFLRDYPAVRRGGRAAAGVPRRTAALVIHNAAFDIALPQRRAGPRTAASRWRSAGRSTRCSWRSAASPARRTAWTRCAAASRSTTRRAPCTAPCSTASCWPRSIST